MHPNGDLCSILYEGMGSAVSTLSQTHLLRTAWFDLTTVLLLAVHTAIEEPISRRDDSQFARKAMWSRARRSSSFSHDYGEVLTR